MKILVQCLISILHSRKVNIFIAIPQFRSFFPPKSVGGSNLIFSEITPGRYAPPIGDDKPRQRRHELIRADTWKWPIIAQCDNRACGTIVVVIVAHWGGPISVTTRLTLVARIVWRDLFYKWIGTKLWDGLKPGSFKRYARGAMKLTCTMHNDGGESEKGREWKTRSRRGARWQYCIKVSRNPWTWSPLGN